MTEQSNICAYCGEKITSKDARAMSEHILACDMRPELGLILKIQLLREMGDNVLNALHETVKLIAEFEGSRSASWEIYRIAKEGWEIAKDAPAQDLSEAVRTDMTGASDAINDR
jgi:hypothetical protein